MPGLLVISLPSGMQGYWGSMVTGRSNSSGAGTLRAVCGAAFGRFAPMQRRVDQAADADDHERSGNQQRGPDPPLITPHEHGDAGIGRIVPTGIGLPLGKAVDDRLGFVQRAPRRVVDVVGIRRVGNALDLIVDLDFGPVEHALFALDLDDPFLDDLASVLHEAVVDPPFGNDQPDDAGNDSRAANHQQDREEDGLADAAQQPGAGPAVASFLFEIPEVASQSRFFVMT